MILRRCGCFAEQLTDAIASLDQRGVLTPLAELIRQVSFSQQSHPICCVSPPALRMVLIEQWGERLGSMGRERTLFDAWQNATANRPSPPESPPWPPQTRTQPPSAPNSPPWLHERIDLSYAARLAVGEDVSWAENARDQIAAFTVHLVNHRPDLDGPWTNTPHPTRPGPRRQPRRTP